MNYLKDGAQSKEMATVNKIFNGREIELLAPVKTFEDFQKIIRSRADAVYFGGKKFNMRVHNSAYNLTDEEIAQAVKIAHDLGKKVYITFNNMMSDSELTDATSYLRFLEQVRPDALIVQDFGAIKLIQELGLDLELHLSVMANVHNEQMVAEALELGVTRVVLSRELPLHEVRRLTDKYPEMEYEYFTHGDMCTVNGAQCYYSGTLFGNSSNRGKCMKPCRWQFDCGSGELDHPLAAKDLSLYRHLPQLINSGVNSFKIEGRMRDVNYMVDLINLYGEAIDRYLADPTGYAIDESAVEVLQENRIRNISTAYAFKRPGAVNIDPGGREPRVFSQPVDERDVLESDVETIKNTLSGGKHNGIPELAVTVNRLSAFKVAVNAGADIIYLSGDVYRPAKPFSLAEIEEACSYGKRHDAKVYYALPRMTNERQFLELDLLVPKLASFGISGLLVSNVGQLRQYRESGLELIGDYGMNVYNKQTMAFYEMRGLARQTLSVEAPASVMAEILSEVVNVEVIVQGAPVMMYLDHCLKAAEHGITADDWCADYCLKEPMDLVDVNGFVHRVRGDQFCKNHVLPMKDFCYVPILNELMAFGTNVVRIEGKDYAPEVLGSLVALYKDLLVSGVNDWRKTVAQVEEVTGVKQSLHALNFK